jgi:peptidoglycan/LPS O-acetylase OafA/YrhL
MQIPGIPIRKIELDFLRGIAILLVMGGHFNYPVTGIAPLDWFDESLKRLGAVGVDLFFTLSGFLVGGLLLREYANTGQLRPFRFLQRRAFKIWPPLYALVLIHAVIGHHDLDTFVWQNLLHVQNYFGTAITQTWSLAVEEHFYIFLALLIWAMVGKSPRFILVILGAFSLLSILMRVLVVANGDAAAALVQSQYRMDSLLYGVILAVVQIFYPALFTWLTRQRWLLAASTTALVVWIYLFATNVELTRSVGFVVHGIGFALLIVQLIGGSPRPKAQLWYRAVAWVGIYSYGMYLWHSIARAPGLAAIKWLDAHDVPSLIAWIGVVILQFGIATALGYAMTRAVEWPFLRLRDRWLPATRKGIAAATESAPKHADSAAVAAIKD